MTQFKNIAALAVVAALVTACGGGGGSSGTPGLGGGTGTGGTTTPAAAPTLVLAAVDGNGAALTDRTLSQTQPFFLRATVRDAAGAAIPFQRVSVALDSTQAVLVPTDGNLLTDSSGVASVRIAPASVNSSGVVRATVTAAVVAATTGVATTLTQTYDLNITAGTLVLQGLAVAPASVQLGQSVNASVNVLVNGQPATSNSASVVFSSSCGTVSPATSPVDGSGRATAVIQTNNQGSCTVNAQAGTVTASAPYTVTAPPTTGVQFVSASPTLIYQTGSPGVNTSVVRFRVVNAVGNPVPGQTVNAALTNTDGGINFCGAPSSSASGADGVVSFSVCAGTLPATVQVRASLAAAPTLFAASNLLTIQTGLPTQRSFSISATQQNFYAGGQFTNRFDGNTVGINVFAADRQGNPVPDGTPIVFVAEGGQINSAGASSCVISAGRCTVTFIGQDYRPLGSSVSGADPRPGRVTILAYADGEESFVDANNNNRYDAGEAFEDMGVPYLDKDEDGVFTAAYTNLIVGTNEGEVTYPIQSSAVGTQACPVPENNLKVARVSPSRANTCNGVWDGFTKVRKAIDIVFSGNTIGQPGDYDASIPTQNRTSVLSATNTQIVVRLADRDGNPLPADAALTAVVIGTAGTCVPTLNGSSIGNSLEPTQHSVTLAGCASGQTIAFRTSVTAGIQTTSSEFRVQVP
ncbi:hypothetical protein ACFX58_00630 [Sphingomonas sp. NCPPB 2930]